MLAPTTDAYSSVVRFGIPAQERRAAGVGAALLFAAGCLFWLVWAVPPGVRGLAAVACGTAAIVLLLRSIRDESVEVDIPARMCRHATGLPPFTSQRSVALSEPLRLIYSVAEEANASNGLPVQVYDAWITMGRRHIALVAGWRDRQAPEFLALLSERLGAVCEAGSPAAGRRYRRLNPGSMMVWAGIVSVFSLMFWPIISGRRPFRPVWGSSSGGRAEREFTLFDQGVRRYRQGQFREAEGVLRDALAAGAPSAETYNMIAYTQAAQKRLDDALQTAKKALSMAPESGNILDTVGEMHEIRKEYTLAVDYYRQALSKLDIAPPIETNAKLGRSLLALGRRKEGISYLREAARFPGAEYGQVALNILNQLGVKAPYPARPPVRVRRAAPGNDPAH